MAVRSVATTDTLETFRTTFNSHATDTGDLASLATSDTSSLVAAINEINTSVAATGFTLRDESSTTQTIVAGKAMFYQQIEVPLLDAFAMANETMLNNITSTEGDAEEGINAFLEKRTPVWQGLQQSQKKQ